MRNIQPKRIASQLLKFIGGIALIVTFLSSPSFAKTKSKKKAPPKITWEECCEENDGNAKKCQKMRNVKGKKSCPDFEPINEPIDDENTTDDEF